MLVPKPIAANAATIKNLLIPLMAPDTATGIQPTLFKIASNRLKQIDERLWHAVVDRLTVTGDNRLVYSLKDGTEITVEL
jgi:hypothetical protein